MYCSVLFVDMVGYSKRTNSEQIALKQKFVSAWTEAINTLPREDIMVIDSGDGAAMTALKDAKDTLRVAEILLKALHKEIEATPSSPFRLRMGIHFGPVELSTNVHGQVCIVGDAINAASRVMGFAQPNQLLVSRTYYEMVTPLLDKSQNVFYSFGIHKDKHGRPHELYEYVEPGSSPSMRPPAPEVPAESKAQPQAVESSVGNGSAATSEKNGATLKAVSSSAYTIASKPFKWAWSVLMKLLTILIVFIFIYELIILVPVLNKPDALRTELNNQTKLAQDFFRLGKHSLNDVSKSTRDAIGAGASAPQKNQQEKTRE